MIPLQPNIKVQQIAFKNVRLELKHETSGKSSRQYLESIHYSVLHRGRVLLSGVEGEVSSGQVCRMRIADYYSLSFYLDFRYTWWFRMW